VHIHPGGQGVVGIINSLKEGGSSESQQNAQLAPPMPDARGNIPGSTEGE
jgi:hypothetical protein